MAGRGIKKDQGWAGRYHRNSSSDNADQVEWEAVLRGVAHISVGTRDDEMSESADQDTFPNARSVDPLEGKDVILESVQGPVAEIVLERQSVLGPAYPFALAGNSLTHRPSPRPVYELMLGITQAPSLTTGSFAQLPRVFEELSMLAGKGFLGGSAGGLRTGWPRPATVSRFQSLIQTLQSTSGCSGGPEWQWMPDTDLPSDPAPAMVKDDGLDLVVWRGWGDGRGGQLYMLGQCACGGNWLEKGGDVQLKSLQRWFRLPSVDPVRSLFLPRYVVPALMTELSVSSGLVFDRVRIVQALRAPNVAVELEAMSEQIASALEVAKA